MRNPTSPTVASSPGVFAGAGPSVAPLVAVLGLAFACSESPTEATLDDLAPQFDRPGSGACMSVDGHCHDEDPPPDPDPTGITATLTNLAPGVFSDGDPSALYDGDNVTPRFKLVPQCADGRTMSLVGVAGLPEELLANQSTCNGDGGWVFFRLPDLLDIQATCFGQPVELSDLQPGQCPFAKIPSFDVRTKGNGDIIFKATGAFAPNAQYFVLDLVTGERYEFLFQDGRLVEVGPDSWHFMADVAHLYIGHQFVCEGTDDLGDPEPETDPKNPALCKDFPLSIDITVTR